MRDLIDEFIAGTSVTGDDALLGVFAHQILDVVGRTDVDSIVAAPSHDMFEVGHMGHDRCHIPAGEVRRLVPLVIGDLVREGVEVADSGVPEGDQIIESCVGHSPNLAVDQEVCCWSSTIARGYRGAEHDPEEPRSGADVTISGNQLSADISAAGATVYQIYHRG